MDKGILELLLLGSLSEDNENWPFYPVLKQSTLVQKKAQGKEVIKMRCESHHAHGIAQEGISVTT